MEEKRDGGQELGIGGKREETARVNQMTEMKPVTKEAYGGGMYANEKDGNRRQDQQQQQQRRASDTQSADGPVEEEASKELKHPPPPSTGDRDLDITGMSYIQ